MKMSAISVIFTFGLLGAPMASACAASITSEDFVATVQPTADFLGASSRLALARSESGRIRSFARGEANAENRTRASLIAWRRDQERAALAAAATPTIDRLGPIVGAVSVPLGAIGTPGSPLTPLPSADRLEAAAQAELGRLSTLLGPDFDSSYRSAQGDALFRLEKAYEDFILNGDDETLRALAVRELPKVQRWIAEVRRL